MILRCPGLKAVFPVIVLILAALLCLAGHAGAGSARPAPHPARIISLSPAITESLYLLGLKESIAGVTTYCDRPADARSKPVVGTVIEPDLEKIVTLRPDLVLAMGLTNQKAIAKMRSLGLKVLTYEIPRTFSGVCTVFLEIGKATGTGDKARRIVSKAQAEVEAIRKSTRNLKKPRVMIELGLKPFFVATADFFVNDYLEFSGAQNIFRDAPSGSVGREEAIMRNPDVILIVTMELSGENEVKAWKRYRSVNAVKGGRIFVIDSDDVCSPTPEGFVRSLRHIVTLLHPDRTGGPK